MSIGDDLIIYVTVNGLDCKSTTYSEVPQSIPPPWNTLRLGWSQSGSPWDILLVDYLCVCVLVSDEVAFPSYESIKTTGQGSRRHPHGL